VPVTTYPPAPATQPARPEDGATNGD